MADDRFKHISDKDLAAYVHGIQAGKVLLWTSQLSAQRVAKEALLDLAAARNEIDELRGIVIDVGQGGIAFTPVRASQTLEEARALQRVQLGLKGARAYVREAEKEGTPA